MKKFLPLAFVLGLMLVPSIVQAYVIQPGDTLWKIAQKLGTTIPHLQEVNGIINPNLIYAGRELQVDEGFLGANPIPTDNYDSFLTAPISGSTSTVFVNDLPSGVSSTIYTIFASDRRTVSEKIYCTGTLSSPNRLTGCTRGVSFSPVDGVISETAGSGSSHSQNSRIAVTDNINFSGKALAVMNGAQPTGAQFFRVGTGTTTSGDPCLALDDGSGATTTRICKNVATDMLYWTADGINTFNFTSSSISTLGASTTKGIFITDSLIGVNASTTRGLQFLSDGSVAVKTSSSLYVDPNGVGVDTTHNFNWTGIHTFNSLGPVTTTPTNGGVPQAATGTAILNKGWLGFQNGGDLTYYDSASSSVKNLPIGASRDFLTVSTTVNSLVYESLNQLFGEDRYVSMQNLPSFTAATAGTGATSVGVPTSQASTGAGGAAGDRASLGSGVMTTSSLNDWTLSFRASLNTVVNTNNIETMGMIASSTAYATSTHVTSGAAFLIADNTMYTITANGSTSTLNVLTGVSPGVFNNYRIERTDTYVKFYVNGVLKATHTTSLPVSDMRIMFGIFEYTPGGSNTGLNVLNNYVYTQEYN